MSSGARKRLVAVGLAVLLLLLAVEPGSQQAAAPTTPTFTAYIASAAGASKDHLTVFNAAGSGILLRVHRAAVGTANTAAVVGAMLYFEVQKVTSAGTTCTSVTLRPHDSVNAALPAQVTATANCTTDPTVAWPWAACSLSTEETAAQPGAQSVPCYEAQRPTDASPQPIILREGEGIGVKQTALAGAGTVGVWITVAR